MTPKKEVGITPGSVTSRLPTYSCK